MTAMGASAEAEIEKRQRQIVDLTRRLAVANDNARGLGGFWQSQSAAIINKQLRTELDHGKLTIEQLFVQFCDHTAEMLRAQDQLNHALRDGQLVVGECDEILRVATQQNAQTEHPKTKAVANKLVIQGQRAELKRFVS